MWGEQAPLPQGEDAAQGAAGEACANLAPLCRRSALATSLCGRGIW